MNKPKGYLKLAMFCFAVAIITALLLLTGCDSPISSNGPNQCMRQKLFKECLELLPIGPRTVSNSNDWDEVVSECGSQAYYQSLRRRDQIDVKCLGN
jgi:hypothetical protein